MLVKYGVYGTPHTKIVCKYGVITRIWGGEEPVITGIAEGSHKPHSKHYYNPPQAIDLRLPSFAKAKAKKLQEELGPEYFVLLEKTHIHLQWNG